MFTPMFSLDHVSPVVLTAQSPVASVSVLSEAHLVEESGVSVLRAHQSKISH